MYAMIRVYVTCMLCGAGSYVGCVERWVSANDHTVEFDDGDTVTFQLKDLQWTVFESEMDSLVGPEPEPEPEPELEPAPRVLPEGSPPVKNKEPGRKKKKRNNNKKKSKATAETSSSPPSVPVPPAPPPLPGGPSSPAEELRGGSRGDLLAAIQNGGIGKLKKTAASEPSVEQVGRPKPPGSRYGPPWDQKPPPGLDIIGEM